MIFRVNVVLTRTVVDCDWRFYNLCSSHFFSIQTNVYVVHDHYLSLRMTTAQVVETLVGSLSSDVFERRTSTGSEVFSLLTCLDDIKFVFLSFFTVIEAIWLKIWAKPPSKNEKRPLPVDVRHSKTLLLKLPSHSQQQSYSGLRSPWPSCSTYLWNESWVLSVPIWTKNYFPVECLLISLYWLPLILWTIKYYLLNLIIMAFEGLLINVSSLI